MGMLEPSRAAASRPRRSAEQIPLITFTCRAPAAAGRDIARHRWLQCISLADITDCAALDRNFTAPGTFSRHIDGANTFLPPNTAHEESATVQFENPLPLFCYVVDMLKLK